MTILAGSTSKLPDRLPRMKKRKESDEDTVVLKKFIIENSRNEEGTAFKKKKLTFD